MTDLISLAERIEALEGPDRVLDVIIGSAVRWLSKDGDEWLRDWRGAFGPMPRMTGRIAAFHDNGDPAVHWEAPPYTASLDAAMTLVPDVEADGGGWRVEQHTDLKARNYAAIWLHAEAEPEDGWIKSIGRTPALALCAASLRARATTNHKDVG